LHIAEHEKNEKHPHGGADLTDAHSHTCSTLHIGGSGGSAQTGTNGGGPYFLLTNQIILVFCGILLLLFAAIHFGFLRHAHHFGAIPFGSLAQFRSGVWPMSVSYSSLFNRNSLAVQATIPES